MEHLLLVSKCILPCNFTKLRNTIVPSLFVQFRVQYFVIQEICVEAFNSTFLTNFHVFCRSFVPPVRDEESETQRKAHAKRVRETRRSTQGVTLEEIKSAEQLVKKKQQQQQQLQQVSSQLNSSIPTTEQTVNWAAVFLIFLTFFFSSTNNFFFNFFTEPHINEFINFTFLHHLWLKPLIIQTNHFSGKLSMRVFCFIDLWRMPVFVTYSHD